MSTVNTAPSSDKIELKREGGNIETMGQPPLSVPTFSVEAVWLISGRSRVEPWDETYICFNFVTMSRKLLSSEDFLKFIYVVYI